MSFPKISLLHSTSSNFVHLTSLNCHSCWIFEDSTQCKATWPSATPPRHRMSSLRCTNQDWWQAAPGIKVKRTENDSRKKNNQTQQHQHKPKHTEQPRAINCALLAFLLLVSQWLGASFLLWHKDKTATPRAKPKDIRYHGLANLKPGVRAATRKATKHLGFSRF